MAFPGLKYASSGLLAALRAGSRLGRRTGKKDKTPPPPPSVAAQEAADATASPVASLAPLTEIIGSYLDKKDVERVREAYRFADQAHLGQFRASGSPYISHPIAVTEICAGWKLDVNALSAALLHDVMEDQGVTKTELAEKFGPEVAELVDGLSKLDRLDFATKAEQRAELPQDAAGDGARARHPDQKLADRLHNMRTLSLVAVLAARPLFRHLPQDGRPEKSFSDVLDIYGFRVIVHTLPECYLALGTLHQLYRPVPGKFKDYIAFPKVNGYQSLHTTLVGPYGTPVEFQFRTRDMHHVAEEGVASHWLYKGADLTSTTCRSALTSGCNRCWTSKARPAIPASSWSTSRSTCSPTLSMCSPRAQDHLAAARWTSPTRFTPTSATRPWPPRSTASSCRCAPK